MVTTVYERELGGPDPRHWKTREEAADIYGYSAAGYVDTQVNSTGELQTVIMERSESEGE